EIAIRRRAYADHGADIGDESISVRPVMLHDRAGVRPRAKEQLQEAVVQDVEETRERVVAHQAPCVRLLGGGKRQRALWTQQPKELDVNTDLPALGLFDLGQIGCRKVHERILPEQNELLTQRGAVTDARAIGERALEPAHHGEEIEAPWLLYGFCQEGWLGRAAIRTGFENGVAR